MRMPASEFEAAVTQALAEIPSRFAPYLERLMIDIEQTPSQDVLRSLMIDDSGELLGLYQGVPLTDRNSDAVPDMPDRVILYQRNIEAVCKSRDELLSEIRATVLHEIGHHFGLDEDDLEALGYG